MYHPKKKVTCCLNQLCQTEKWKREFAQAQWLVHAEDIQEEKVVSVGVFIITWGWPRFLLNQFISEMAATLHQELLSFWLKPPPKHLLKGLDIGFSHTPPHMFRSQIKKRTHNKHCPDGVRSIPISKKRPKKRKK